ncbi:MAG: hypothetical protein ABIH66_06315 [bacterium]
MELLKLFVPRSEISIREFCGHMNRLCGEREEILLGRLADGVGQEDLLEQKEEELLVVLKEAVEQRP